MFTDRRPRGCTGCSRENNFTATVNDVLTDLVFVLLLDVMRVQYCQVRSILPELGVVGGVGKVFRAWCVGAKKYTP